MEKSIIEVLKKRGETVATAESCTGGGVIRKLTEIPGASSVVVGGIVAYWPSIKHDELGVDARLVTDQTIVSCATAQSMALGIKKRFGATWGLATTGFAGPTGGNDTYDVGTVCIAIAGPNRMLISKTLHLQNETRKNVMEKAAAQILSEFYSNLL